MLALMLCVVLIFGMMPITAGAEDEVSTEVVSLREENIKHFDMGDGTYQAVVYSHPVHELDSQGAWQDIDFGLSLDRTNKVTTYTSKASGTAFAANYMENSTLMTLSGGEDSISMTLVVPQTAATAWTAKRTVAAKVTEADTAAKTFEEAKNAKFSNTVLYENVLPNIDLEYIADPYMVKENIIVRQPMETYTYTFALDMAGLYPELAAEGCVYIYDAETDERKYEIAMPYMYDGLGNMSEAVYYTLKEEGEVYFLTVAADAEWINESGRQFPVTIDPPVTVTAANVEDTCIIATQPGSKLGATHNLWIRADRTSYIKSLTTFVPPGNFVLMNAKLIGYYYYYDYVHSGSLLMSAHRVTIPWSESTLTWNIANNWENQGLAVTALDYQRAYGSIGATVDSPAKIELNITQAAQDWAKGKYENYGIGLQFEGGNTSVIIKSSETGTTYSPRFIYQYGNDYYYTSFYDSTMSDKTAYIPQAVEAANAAFSNLFGVYFAEGELSYDSTLADACLYGPNDPCDAYCGTTHHKDTNYITDQLEDRLQGDRERIVYWTDRNGGTYCNHSNGTCIPEDSVLAPVLAQVYIARPKVIHMMNMVPDNASVDLLEACMGITLIHETAHTFGYPDVYDDGNDPGDHDIDGWHCVMERYNSSDVNALLTFYDELSTKQCSAFCNRCAVSLRTLINNAQS